MNQVNPVSGVARIYETLAHVKVFPIPLRTVAIVSGISEDVIREIIASSIFIIIDDQIQPHADSDRLKHLSIGDADFLYRSSGLATYCKDGRPYWMQVDGYADVSLSYSVNLLAWRMGEALEQRIVH